MSIRMYSLSGEFIEVKNKKGFLALPLLADEQENVIDRYIGNGIMYVLNDNRVKALD